MEQYEVLFNYRSEKWRLLSNMAHTPFEINGIRYLSVEHYYQSMKSIDRFEQRFVREDPNAFEAKLRGKSVTLHPHWPEVKDAVMETALEAKFAQHEPSRRLLLSTGDAALVHDAPWDAYWGAGRHGNGLNALGDMLESFRTHYRKEQS